MVSDRDIKGIVVNCRDITEKYLIQKKYEKISRQSELILEMVAEGIFGINSHGVIIFANLAASNIIKKSKSFIEDNHLSGVVDLIGADKKKIKFEHSSIRSEESKGSAFEFEIEFTRPGKSSVEKSVDIANNGKEAIDLYAKNEYDIIFLDLQMPIYDGMQAATEIRKMAAQSGTNPPPIVVLSANVMRGTRETLISQGYEGSLKKVMEEIRLIESIL